MKGLLWGWLMVCGVAGVCFGEEKERFEGVWRELGETVTLKHGAIYESKGEKEIETVLVFSEKPVNRELLLKSLKRDGTDALVVPNSTQIKLKLDAGGKVSWFEMTEIEGSSKSQMSGGVSKKEAEEYQVQLKREGGRIEGSVVYPRADSVTSKLSLSGYDLKFAGELIRIPAEAEENIKRAAQEPAPVGKVTGKLKATNGLKGAKPVAIDLKYVVVYESYFFDKDLHLNVVMSDQPIPLKELRNQLAREGNDDGMFLDGSTVHLEYQDGVLHLSRVLVKGGSWSEQWVQTDLIKSTIEMKEGRVTGRASQELVAKREKPKSTFGPKGTLEFDVAFEGGLLAVPEFEERKKQKAEKDAVPQGKVTGKAKTGASHFALTHGLAYRVKGERLNKGNAVCVLFRPVHTDVEALRKEVGKTPIKDAHLSGKPWVKFYFDETGDCVLCKGCNQQWYGLDSDQVSGSIKVEKGRVTGKAKTGPSSFPRDDSDWIIDATFDVELIEGNVEEGKPEVVKEEETPVFDALAISLFSLPESVWDLAELLWVFLRMFAGWSVAVG